MARFRSPRNYHDDILSFKNPRKISWLEHQEIAKKNRAKKKNTQPEHFKKDWEKDLWD